MSKNKNAYTAFKIEDRKKFLSEVEPLSGRIKNILFHNDLMTWDAFYHYVFLSHTFRNFEDLRNSGHLTKTELLGLIRRILNPDKLHMRLIEKFDKELGQLGPKARSFLIKTGIGSFETFYYRLVINKEIIELRCYGYTSNQTVTEARKFIDSFCAFLGVKVPKKTPFVYFDPKNPEIPFVPEKETLRLFNSEFQNLSKSTRNFLTTTKATTIQGFYLSFIDRASPFSQVLKDIGESDLSEILKFRSLVEEQIKNNSN